SRPETWKACLLSSPTSRQQHGMGRASGALVLSNALLFSFLSICGFFYRLTKFVISAKFVLGVDQHGLDKQDQPQTAANSSSPPEVEQETDDGDLCPICFLDSHRNATLVEHRPLECPTCQKIICMTCSRKIVTMCK